MNALPQPIATLLWLHYLIVCQVADFDPMSWVSYLSICMVILIHSFLAHRVWDEIRIHC
jgi:hypothetical protein